MERGTITAARARPADCSDVTDLAQAKAELVELRALCRGLDVDHLELIWSADAELGGGAGDEDDESKLPAAGSGPQLVGADSLRTESATAALSEFATMTKFNEVEIKQIYKIYREAAAEDGTLSKEAFQGATGQLAQFGLSQGLKDSAFFTFVFQAFDTNGDGKLSLQELAFGLNVLSQGSRDDKLAFAFALFDAVGYFSAFGSASLFGFGGGGGSEHTSILHVPVTSVLLYLVRSGH